MARFVAHTPMRVAEFFGALPPVALPAAAFAAAEDGAELEVCEGISSYLLPPDCVFFSESSVLLRALASLAVTEFSIIGVTSAGSAASADVLLEFSGNTST